MKYEVVRTPEFENWYLEQSRKTQWIISARIERIEAEGHWGFVNRFDGLTELKWTSGLRVYAAELKNVTVIVLLGGNKNGQNKDIKKAKKLLAERLENMEAGSKTPSG